MAAGLRWGGLAALGGCVGERFRSIAVSQFHRGGEAAPWGQVARWVGSEVLRLPLREDEGESSLTLAPKGSEWGRCVKWG